MHMVDEQSSFGGGGGNALSGGRTGIFGLFDPEGETLGGRRGILVWLDAAFGGGEGAGETLLIGEGRGT